MIAKAPKLVRCASMRQALRNCVWEQNQVKKNKDIKILGDTIVIILPRFERKQNKQFCYIYRILCWLSSSELLLCTVWSHGEWTKCQILGKCSHTMRHLWIPIRMPILCCASNWESRLYEAYLSRQVWLASELCAPSSYWYSSTPSHTWYLFYNK